MNATLLPSPSSNPIVYPDSDGQPMADNTEQFDWIGVFKWGFDALLAANPEVFVGGDLLWYPVEGNNQIRLAPDTLIAFGRPKGRRGSYRQWEEGGIAPQVVFEVLSPGNRFSEMQRKFEFYEQYGVEEYYVYDPSDFDFSGWLRDPASDRLRPIHPISGFTSPRLGVRFVATGEEPLVIQRPDGKPFQSPVEVYLERDRAVQERDAAERERDRLAAKLRELGIDPATL